MMISLQKIVLVCAVTFMSFQFSFLAATACGSDNPCSGSATCTWYYHDADNDGLGETNGAGFYCSGTSNDSNGFERTNNC